MQRRSDFKRFKRKEAFANEKDMVINMNDLSPIEKKIYDYVNRVLSEKGYSPSVRDIKNALSVKSTSTVHHYLNRLEERGYIFKEDGKSRTVRTDEISGALRHRIPILGPLSQGSPLDADENFDGYVDFISPIGSRENLFAVRIKGDDLKAEGIIDGDVAIVDKSFCGESDGAVAAVNKKDFSLKLFFKEKNILKTLSKSVTSTDPNDVIIIGKIIALLRYY